MNSKAENRTQLPKVVIFGDPRRRHAAEAVDEFKAFTRGRVEIVANCFGDNCKVDTLKNADLAVVFGGDGTILSAARSLCQTNVPVVGINVGRLGFLAEFSIEEFKQHFERIVNDKSLVERRMILRCDIVSADQKKFSYTAVNDVVIASGMPFHMIELQMTIGGQKLAGCAGDGIIISTPTGSTAYNLSAGGPILSGDISAMVITPVSAHSLSFRPIVINAESNIEIIPIRINEGTHVILDGQMLIKISAEDTIRIRKNECTFHIINNPSRTRYDTLAEKLNWAEKPKYRNHVSDKEE